MRRVYGYCRVSGRDQGNYGTSLAAQQETIARYCEAKQLCKPDLRVEVDSGANESREQLSAIIAAASSGDTVLVTRVDRWSRDIVHAVRTVRDLVARGVTWVALEDNIDATTPHGDHMLGLMSWVADGERRRIRERTVGRRKQLRDAGCWVEGPAPYGYRRGADRRLVVHEDEASVVRELFARCVAGAPLSQLSTWARSLGWRRDRAGIHTSLRRRWYLGQMCTTQGVWVDAHEPIISRDVFDAAQKALASRRWNGRYGRSPRSARFLLRGIASCSECGARMGYAYSRDRDYYACARRLRDRAACAMPYVSVDEVDHDLNLLTLERLVAIRHLLAEPPETSVAPTAHLASRVAALQRKRRRVVDMGADGILAAQDVRERTGVVDTELGELAALQAAEARETAFAAPGARAAMLGCVDVLERAWRRALPGQRREVIDALALQITVHPSGARPVWCDVGELSALTYFVRQFKALLVA